MSDYHQTKTEAAREKGAREQLRRDIGILPPSRDPVPVEDLARQAIDPKTAEAEQGASSP